MDGFPLSRNPSDLIFFLKYLIICKECIKDAQQYVPEFLRILLTKSHFIQSLLTPNDKVPLFNGSIEEIEDFKKFTDLRVKKER